MPPFEYGQFCPLARATEIVGERWTLLVVRELLLGPQRFSDLRRRLPGVSSSVLATRLERLEERGLVRRRELRPPAASIVYELTGAGAALKPALVELTRWGARFLLPPRLDEHLEPDWLRLGFYAFARRDASPACSFEVRVVSAADDVVVVVHGGPDGTTVDDGPGHADAVLRAEPRVLLGLLSGVIDPDAAARDGSLEIEGDRAAAARFPRLFEVDLGSRDEAEDARAHEA